MNGPTRTRAAKKGIKLCVVGDNDVVAAVLAGCPPPNKVLPFPGKGIVDENGLLAEEGGAILTAATDAAAVLVAWRLEQAPVINTLCYHMRLTLRAPVIAFCDGDEEQVAALAAGVDTTLRLPLHLPLVCAEAEAYRRLARAATLAARGEGIEKGTPPPTAAARAVQSEHVLQIGFLLLERAAHRFYIREQRVELTPREFLLLEYLMMNANMALTRDQILDGVWGINFDTGTNMVDVYMHFLRRKLAAYGLKDTIQTVRGYGYRLVVHA